MLGMRGRWRVAGVTHTRRDMPNVGRFFYFCRLARFFCTSKRGGILMVNASRREHRSYSSLIGNAVMNSGEFLMPLWGVTFKEIMSPLGQGGLQGVSPPRPTPPLRGRGFQEVN